MTTNQIAYHQLQEDKRSNLAVETETNRHNLRTEEEANRHNVASEGLTKRDQDLDYTIRTEQNKQSQYANDIKLGSLNLDVSKHQLDAYKHKVDTAENWMDRALKEQEIKANHPLFYGQDVVPAMLETVKGISTGYDNFINQKPILPTPPGGTFFNNQIIGGNQNG